MPRFPNVVGKAQSLSDAVYSALVEKAKTKTGEIFPLHVGDTYREPPVWALSEFQVRTRFSRLHNYAPVQGEPELLDVISERLAEQSEIDISKECIQVMAGATNGLCIVCSSLLDPGDEVILLSPFWPLIRGIVHSTKGQVVEVPFWDRVNDSTFDPCAAIVSAVTDRTVAIYINSPNNPTGVIASEELVISIGNIAKKYNLWILDDLAYDELWFDQLPPLSLGMRRAFCDHTISSYTFSKSFGLSGARVGWVTGPLLAMRTIRGLQTFQNYCAARPMQLGAAMALRTGQSWIQEARNEYKRAAELAAQTVGVSVPQGGTFLFFDASKYFQKNETMTGFLERCLDAGVLLTPGSASGKDYGNWVRLCFTAVPYEKLQRAMKALSHVLKR